MDNRLFSREYEIVSLDQWVQNHNSEEELRSIFLNVDRALKYIHDHGYCIEVFYPSQINVLNNEIDHIQFKKLMELSSDFSVRKNMISEDIFNSALVQIGIYSNSLKYLTPEFLRENFDSFIQFIPTEDVPYYQGIVKRGASVYLCEYVLEKEKRDFEALEAELGEEVSADEKKLLKSNNSITNEKINDEIYKQINGMRDSAFIYALVIPSIIFGVLFLFGIIAWIFSLISL